MPRSPSATTSIPNFPVRQLGVLEVRQVYRSESVAQVGTRHHRGQDAVGVAPARRLRVNHVHLLRLVEVHSFDAFKGDHWKMIGNEVEISTGNIAIGKFHRKFPVEKRFGAGNFQFPVF